MPWPPPRSDLYKSHLSFIQFSHLSHCRVNTMAKCSLARNFTPFKGCRLHGYFCGNWYHKRGQIIWTNFVWMDWMAMKLWSTIQVSFRASAFLISRKHLPQFCYQNSDSQSSRCVKNRLPKLPKHHFLTPMVLLYTFNIRTGLRVL